MSGAIGSALNQTNSLFLLQNWGNEKGGETAALLSSLTSSCTRHEVDPQVYRTQRLVNLPGMPAGELGAWLPDAWKSRKAE